MLQKISLCHVARGVTMNTKIIKTMVATAILGFSFSSFAVTLEVANEPLQTKSLPPTPNVMLLIDDSGSMGVAYGGDDVFYSKGYNFKKVYKCPDNVQIIEPDNTKSVFAKMNKNTGIGYFGWGDADYAVAATPLTSSYDIYSCSGLSSGLQFFRGGVWNTSSYSVTSYSFGAGVLTRTSISHPSTTKSDCKAHYNNGNGVINASNNRGGTSTNSYTYKKLNDDFILNTSSFRPPQVACFDPDEKYNVNLKVSCLPGIPDCAALESEQDLIDHDANNSTPKVRAIPEQLDGNFLNWYFSNQSTTWIKDNYVKPTSEDDLNVVINDYAQDFNTTGYKTGTKITHERIDVAKDVAQILVGFYSNLNIGLSTFRSGSGAEIDHKFAIIGNFNTDTTTDGSETVENSNNRTSLFNEISSFSANGSTPLAESMATVARYFAKRPDNTDIIRLPEFQNSDGDTVAEADKSAATVFSSSGQNVSITKSSEAAWGAQNSNTWCRKSYLVTLTDGAPNADNNVYGESRSWIDDKRTSTDNYTGNSYYANDIAAALYDIDLRPDLDNNNGDELKHNVTTFSIGFGRQVASGTEGDFLRDVAQKGGGSFFSATSGVELANAFKTIADTIASKSISVGLVASSSVSELRTANLTFKGGYETGQWTGNIKSFFLTSNGQFQNAVLSADGALTSQAGSVPDDSTVNVSPVWDTADVMNKMYVLSGDPSNYRGLEHRRIFTVKKTSGASASFEGLDFTFANLNNFDPVMISDLKTGDDAEDIINFIRGDVSKEVNIAPLTADQKFRDRFESVNKNGDGNITEVEKGSILGTVVNSSPAYLSESPRPWGDTSYGDTDKLYSQFAKSNALTTDSELPTRPPVLYFGANDGMFHAVTVNGYNVSDSDTSKQYPAGSELWAYIPSFIASAEEDKGLHYLANRQYEHRYYLNMKPTISEVFWDHNASAVNPDKNWRSILVSGVGAGGKGVFAFDITCPLPSYNASDDYALKQCESKSDVMVHKSHTAEEKLAAFNKSFLWEFDSSDNNHMGLSYTNPVIGKINFDARLGNKDRNGSSAIGRKGRWAAIVNNGYNSATGKAVLFILFLDGGQDGVWTKGQDYLELHASDRGIDTPATVDTVASANGLSSPIALDSDNDGAIDKIYAGDLKGNMWVFNVKDEVKKSNNPANTDVSSDWSVHKLFTTQSNQPITTAPRIAKITDALKQTQPHGISKLPTVDDPVMVTFGTGLYLQSTDVTDKTLQSFYSVLDDGQTYGLTVDTVKNGKKAFVKRYILNYLIDGQGKSAGKQFLTRTVVDSNGINGVNVKGDPEEIDYENQFGWYIDLYAGELAGDFNSGFTATSGFKSSAGKEEGERVAYNPLLINDLALFTGITPTNGQCSGGLEGFLMAVSWLSGLPRYETAVFDANRDGATVSSNINGSDLGFMGVFSTSMGESSYVSGRVLTTIGDDIQSSSFNPGGAEGRSGNLSWQEVFPY